MPTRASSVRSLTSGSRSADGVECLRVEVALGGRHDPQALGAEALVLRHVRVADLARPATVPPSGAIGVRGPGQQLVGRALDVGADDGAAVLVRHLVEGGHELVGGVERDLGDARVLLAGQAPGRRRPWRQGRRARPRSDRRPGRRPWRRRRRTAPSAAGSARAAPRPMPASPAMWPVRRVALAADREAVARRSPSATAVIWFSVSVPVLSELIAEVEPSVSTERSRFTMAPALASVDVPAARIGRHDGGQAGRDGRHRERHRGQEQRRRTAGRATGRARSRSPARRRR